MRKELYRLNQKGFTLIEMVSVMIIMGVVASVSIQKFDIVSDTANQRALTAGIKELNVRESLEWSNVKISGNGYTTDEDLWTLVVTNLGSDYQWTAGPDRVSGGTLTFKTASRVLSRQPSTETSAGRWN
ncbi:MAG: prepilin-type N-terminal cleavage/methylation domain-containing protein [Desulfobacterales bacterium]|nr:prepilin-type N-terminal cleavage/methylation domain-containing protein [Desulfobacterales bacterium]